MNVGVRSHSRLWPERGFSLSENSDVQRQMWEFELIYSREPCQTTAKVVKWDGRGGSKGCHRGFWRGPGSGRWRQEHVIYERLMLPLRCVRTRLDAEEKI